jgi:hypothetical protein
MTVAADLYRLNVNTGAATLVAAQANTLPEGDISFSGGVLYHTSSAGMVSTVDTATGALTPFVDISAGGSDFSGLTVTSTLSVALALNGTDADSLVVFSAGGIFTSMLPGTNGVSVGGLASDGTRAWMTDGTSLFELSTSSGTATLLGGHGVGGMSGLAFVPTPGAAGLLALGALAAGRRRR